MSEVWGAGGGLVSLSPSSLYYATFQVWVGFTFFFYPIFPVWPIGLDSEHLFQIDYYN